LEFVADRVRGKFDVALAEEAGHLEIFGPAQGDGGPTLRAGGLSPRTHFETAEYAEHAEEGETTDEGTAGPGKGRERIHALVLEDEVARSANSRSNRMSSISAIYISSGHRRAKRRHLFLTKLRNLYMNRPPGGLHEDIAENG
jgi:hypothetical protein